MEGNMRKNKNFSKKLNYVFCIVVPIVLILIINIVDGIRHHDISRRMENIIYSRHLSEFKKDKYGGLRKRKNTNTKNLDYNNISDQLTKEELYEVLKNMNELPPENELMNLWHQSLNVGKHMTEMLTELKSIIQPYLDKYESEYDGNLRSEATWFQCLVDIGENLLDIELRYNNEFKRLLNKEPTLDNIKDHIYSCILAFDETKKDLYKKYKDFFERILDNKGLRS
ncbi:Plasmodium exported protein (PHISTa), unknown, putative [Plasmodium gaboni]|uniref:Plasmodium RESA N-terminal domain-containing protein n=1 Tax=Plasmodium gaboni TaxID=647221 RepID=A0ABY1UJ58_9APIC|nr:Plasmodium exported protein (PHISTa), unknown, putative [Plasmodium gaboni]